MRNGPYDLVSSIYEQVLKSLEERVEVIIQLDGKVVVEVSARHDGWCALLFSVPIYGVTFISAEINATAPKIKHGLLITKPGASEDAVDRQLIHYVENTVSTVPLIFTSKLLVPLILSSWLPPNKAACPAVDLSHVPTCAILIRLKLATVTRSV